MKPKTWNLLETLQTEEAENEDQTVQTQNNTTAVGGIRQLSIECKINQEIE